MNTKRLFLLDKIRLFLLQKRDRRSRTYLPKKVNPITENIMPKAVKSAVSPMVKSVAIPMVGPAMNLTALEIKIEK